MWRPEQDFIHEADKITSWSYKRNVISSRTNLKIQAIERFLTLTIGSTEMNGNCLYPNKFEMNFNSGKITFKYKEMILLKS